MQHPRPCAAYAPALHRPCTGSARPLHRCCNDSRRRPRRIGSGRNGKPDRQSRVTKQSNNDAGCKQIQRSGYDDQRRSKPRRLDVRSRKTGNLSRRTRYAAPGKSTTHRVIPRHAAINADQAALAYVQTKRQARARRVRTPALPDAGAAESARRADFVPRAAGVRRASTLSIALACSRWPGLSAR